MTLALIDSRRDEWLYGTSMKVLLNIATTKRGASALACFGTFTSLIEVIMDPSVNMNIRRDCLHVIGGLCENYEDNRTLFFNANGIEKMVQLLISDRNNSRMNGEFVFSLIDCVWSSIIGRDENEMSFIRLDGVIVMFDIFENCNLHIKSQILGLLMDLCTKYKTEISEDFHAWKSVHSGKSMALLLVELWAGFTQQLDKADEKINDIPESEEDIAKLIDLDFKPKIFNMFDLIGFEGHHLDNRHLAVLVDIREHKRVLLGDVWKRIATELENEGVRPITPDMQILRQHMEDDALLRQQIEQQVDAYMEKEQKKTKLEEDEFFRQLMEREDTPPPSYRGMSVMEIKMRKDEMLKNSLRNTYRLNEKGEIVVQLANVSSLRDPLSRIEDRFV